MGWKDERGILNQKIVTKQYHHLIFPKFLISSSSTVSSFVSFGNGQKQEFHARLYMCICDMDKNFDKDLYSFWILVLRVQLL